MQLVHFKNLKAATTKKQKCSNKSNSSKIYYTVLLEMTMTSDKAVTFLRKIIVHVLRKLNI